IFEFNQFVDRNAIVPVAKAYRDTVPDPVRDSLRDFLNNLRAPIIFVNDALQGQFQQAGETVGRFVINSTIGMGGVVDVAGRWGVPFHEEDLGLTLGTWGIPEGPYLVVPILGPSTPRDLGGQVAEGFGDPWNRLVTGSPWNLYWIPFVRGATAGIDQRSRYIETLADIERTSLDYYATIRSLYRQRRAALIRHERENLPPPPAYSTRLAEYTGEKFKVTGSRPDADGATVSSQIIRPAGGPPVKVDWRLTGRNGVYKISDVSVDGISMAVTQRSEFASVIQHNGGQVQSLITMLRERSAGSGAR